MERIKSHVFIDADQAAILLFQERVRDLIYLEDIDVNTLRNYEDRSFYLLQRSTLNINLKLLSSLGFDRRDYLS